jgi:predicted nucleic acid-binding protein
VERPVSFLLDSVILIDHFNGIDAATEFLRKHARSAAISAITRAEVLAGFNDADAPLAMQLLDQLKFLPMDLAVADEAARLRRRTRLKLSDAIQAAFAICHGLQLATRNTRDFPSARFDFVKIPYSI